MTQGRCPSCQERPFTLLGQLRRDQYGVAACTACGARLRSATHAYEWGSLAIGVIVGRGLIGMVPASGAALWGISIAGFVVAMAVASKVAMRITRYELADPGVVALPAGRIVTRDD